MSGGRETWEAVGAEWVRRRPHRTWRAHSDAISRRLLARWLPQPALRAVLKTDAFDEAFGEGVAGDLAPRAGQVWLADLSLTTLRVARRRDPRLRAAVCDVRRLPYDDASFDAVVSLSTLDHFARRDQIDAALRELARVLASGGRLVVTLDNARNPAVGLRNRLPYAWLRRAGLVPYPIGVTLDAAALSDALERAGLDVRASAAVMHCPRAPAVLAAGLIDRWGGTRARGAFLRAALAFERLGGWSTRRWTGYFVAALGVKAGGGDGQRAAVRGT